MRHSLGNGLLRFCPECRRKCEGPVRFKEREQAHRGPSGLVGICRARRQGGRNHAPTTTSDRPALCHTFRNIASCPCLRNSPGRAPGRQELDPAGGQRVRRSDPLALCEAQQPLGIAKWRRAGNRPTGSRNRFPAVRDENRLNNTGQLARSFCPHRIVIAPKGGLTACGVVEENDDVALDCDWG